MQLSDGRQIMRKDRFDADPNSNNIVVHPDFRMIVLGKPCFVVVGCGWLCFAIHGLTFYSSLNKANRPGFPFLGNDFFREAGDCFDVHVIRHPPTSTMEEMLRSYAPNEQHVPDHVIRRLSSSFHELHELYVDGTLSYPYR